MTEERDVVETGLDAVEQLLSLGREQGFLTYDDILAIFPEVETNLEQLEELFVANTLQELSRIELRNIDVKLGSPEI